MSKIQDLIQALNSLSLAMSISKEESIISEDIALYGCRLMPSSNQQCYSEGFEDGMRERLTDNTGHRS